MSHAARFFLSGRMGLVRSATAGVLLFLGLVLAAPARAQPVFSIDFQGPPKGFPDGCTGIPLTEGDILVAFTGVPAPGPIPFPCIFVAAGPPGFGLGLPAYPGAAGVPPGVPGFVEVDAISFGMDVPLQPTSLVRWYFSVDEWASGIAGAPIPPTVWTEGLVFGTAEASADVFVDLGLPTPQPFCGFVTPTMQLYDGNGLFPTGAPGFGLLEPNLAAPGVPDAGTNLDGLDVDIFPVFGPPFFGPVWFSLDANGAVFDFLEGFPGTGSGLVNGGFSGADLLVSFPGGPPFIWAPSFLLGLDTFGFNTDDIDALIYWENGTGAYEPPLGPYSWVFGGTDMIFFSLRRGSASLGAIDVFCGLPIEEGDVLMPLGPGGPLGIWITAEALGLATLRSGTAPPGLPGDDLDALDVALDCNFSLIPDNVDILVYGVPDLDGNLVPDTCQCVCCDMNCDGVVDVFDINSFILLLTGVIPPCGPCVGDTNGDGVIDSFDIFGFIQCLTLLC